MRKSLLFLAMGLIVPFMLQATVYTRIGVKPTEGWSGKYLIVYQTSDTKAIVWNGEDEASNYVEATINNGKITADNLDDYVVTVAAEGRDYSIHCTNGYIRAEAKKNSLEFAKGASACTINANGGYIRIETNSGTQRFCCYSGSRFRFYYDEKKQWADNKYGNVYFYVVGDQEVDDGSNNLDINYAHAELYACDSKFPNIHDPYTQYYMTYLFLAQREDDNAIPQVGIEMLAPTQYSLAVTNDGKSTTYSSDYEPERKGYVNITNGSAHSYFDFPSKAEAGYSTAAIRKLLMTITAVKPSTKPNAYVYHIKLEFTDSNQKIWKLDKDLDVYGWWIECDRSDSKNPKDMEPVAFTFESGNHNPAPTALPEVIRDNGAQSKYIHNGQLILLHDGIEYNALGQRLH